ncbi:MAG TPA: hypothetical protein VKH19_07830, partial [Gemmatimonadaceae bacterium]|nr:hypothetical protein [Gemmatimonadaceae bacterium]
MIPSLFLVLQLATTQASPRPVMSAFESARSLVARARSARYQQDSTLASYQAIAKQRMSAGIGVAPGFRGGLAAIGRVRLMARYESVARVGWDHDLGAWGEMLASRSVVPFLGGHDAEPDADDIALTLPYYPGRDRLWPMTELSDALHEGLHRDVPWIEHPLDAGADSLYQLALGDSIAFRLPDASTIRLREIRVRPRRPDQRLMVGSLWVDIATGALVRAAYRPSTPMDLWPFFDREMDADDRAAFQKFGPYMGNVREIVVEHGLYEGRFWLPRTRMAMGEGTARGMRITIEIQQTFRYERVAGVPAGSVARVVMPAPDIDPRDGRVRRPTWRGREDSDSRCREHGDTSAINRPESLMRDSSLSVMWSEGVRFRVLLPCDRRDLLASSELPASIYGRGEELFSETDFSALQRDANAALAMDRQADWSPQKPRISVGFQHGLMRYNRVEGLSVAARVDRELGKGYVAFGVARLGVADLQPNAEASIQRGNARLTLDATAYRRLSAANEWGNPAGAGASVTALLFGRDEGLWYRTMGVETKGVLQSLGGNSAVSWRVFAEQQDSAVVETQFSAAHAMNGVRFMAALPANAGMYYGSAAALTFVAGSDPRGLRLGGSVHGDGAGGEMAYGRGLLELTLNQALGRATQATLTGSAG